MKVKILKEVNLPVKKREGDAGFDLHSPEDIVLTKKSLTVIKLGISIEIEGNEVGLIQERSGMAMKNNVFTIGNIIDSNYRGEISAMIYNPTEIDIEVKKNDRIAQLVLLQLGSSNIELVEELSETVRGENGYGSSGK